MKKYVLEVGTEGFYASCYITERRLYDTYEKAYKAYEDLLKKEYPSEDLDSLKGV